MPRQAIWKQPAKPHVAPVTVKYTPLIPWLEDHLDKRRVERVLDWLKEAGYPMEFESGSGLILRGWVVNSALAVIVEGSESLWLDPEAYLVAGVEPLEELR